MLCNVVDRSFILVRANWPADKVRRMVERLQPSHIIVGQADQAGAYYLVRTREILDLLATAKDQAPAQVALGLDQRPATPILNAYDDELSAPDQAVVLDEGRVIGFMDSGMAPPTPPPPFTRSLGPAERAELSSRTVVADFPLQVVVGETYSLVVYVSADMSAGQHPIAVPTGTTIEVVVQPLHRFELVGPREEDREDSIKVTDEKKTLPLQFKFKATEVGLGSIMIFIFPQGQSLGRGTLTIESQVLAAADPVNAASSTKRETRLPARGDIPDLLLTIMENSGGGQPCLTFKLETREPDNSHRTNQKFGPVPIKLSTQQHFREFFRTIQNLPLGSDRDQLGSDRDRKVAEFTLSSKCTELYCALVPEPLRNLLWDLRERIHSVQLLSDDPWIPWELCKLQGRENDRIVPGQFFCEAFAMTRWFTSLTDDKLALQLRNVALVVPKSSGLALADSERTYMLSLGNGDRRINLIPAILEDILAALDSGLYDGWHFTGHGRAKENPRLQENPRLEEELVLELELDDQYGFNPEYLSGVPNVGIPQPLVFLNACQSGQSVMSLTGIKNWAKSFLEAAHSEQYPKCGAAAFIGTYWEVDDDAAFGFARAFYTKLLEEKQTIGEAVRAARQAIRAKGDKNWLAYTVFAHPLAKLQS